MYSVETVWLNKDKKQIGATLSDGHSQIEVTTAELEHYKGKLQNAYIIGNNLIRAKKGNKLIRAVISSHTGIPNATYTLMYEDTVVLTSHIPTNTVTIITSTLVPYALRTRGTAPLTAVDVDRWITHRVDNLGRTYMNRVYMAMKVGRDRDNILRNSCGISIIDKYWIKYAGITTSWAELKSARDTSTTLANIALTGNISQDDFQSLSRETTSLFTIKGAFPKAILQNYILKKGDNAEYEAVAYTLGSALNIPTAKATISDGVVYSEIFTQDSISMVHARELMQFTKFDPSVPDDYHRAIYDYFKSLGRQDIVAQLERLFIFNYLVLNMDFHDENFGFLYDDKLHILRVAPGYDYNNAFGPWIDHTLFYEWIFAQLPNYIKNHPDIAQRLRSNSFHNTLTNISELTSEQKDVILSRANYLCSLQPPPNTTRV